MRRILLCAWLLLFGLVGCSGKDCGEPTALPAAREVLLHPDSSAFKVIPPDTFRVRMATSKGDFIIEVVREWSPMGAYRFYNLVRNGYFDGTRFYRVVPGFVAQFGASGYPAVERAWAKKYMPGDPIRVSNRRGMVTFAQASKNTRNTQLFINLRDNQELDGQNFSPIGRIISGGDVALTLNGEYGEMKPEGTGPVWRCVYYGGNNYFSRNYPRLDSITRAHVLEPGDTSYKSASR